MLADRLIVPTVPEFDYPRSDLPAHVRYVGAVHPAPSRGFRPPGWWSDLDDGRPVVHVTQGTIDNADLGRLLEPTIEALGAEDVIVVANTGGRDISGLKVPLPLNTHVAEYILHDLLLPKIDVTVNNGGLRGATRPVGGCATGGCRQYRGQAGGRRAGGVVGSGRQSADRYADPGVVRTAVREVLSDARYLQRAREFEAAFARRDGVAEIAAIVDEVISENEATLR